MTRLPLKESLFLGFCAVFILLFRVVLRLHLHIPGHAMLFTVFFLFLARGCVNYRAAATCTGLLSGLGAFALGLGKAGPILIPAFVLPGMIIDLGAFLLPGLFRSRILCVLVAAAASATKFIMTLAQDLLLGMDKKVMVQHAAFEAGTAMIFGIVGGLLVVPVIRRLKAYGLVGQRLEITSEDDQHIEEEQ
jgi:hypothetical protein